MPRGSPSDRRRFLDRAVFNWRSGHLLAAQELREAAQAAQRSAQGLLEHPGAKGGMGLLDVYDDQLAVAGRTRHRRRARATSRPSRPHLGRGVRRHHPHGLVGRGLATRPRRRWRPRALDEAALSAAMHEQLRASRGRDRGSRQHQHRAPPRRPGVRARRPARPSLRLPGPAAGHGAGLEDRRDGASGRGHGDPPVLLLDDVSSELDPRATAIYSNSLGPEPTSASSPPPIREHVLVSPRSGSIRGG